MENNDPSQTNNPSQNNGRNRNNSSQNNGRNNQSRRQLDEYIIQQTELLHNSVTATERRNSSRVLVDSVNYYLETHRNIEDSRCAFVNVRNGQRCYGAKGKYRKRGSPRLYQSDYCTSGKKHHQYLEYMEKKRQEALEAQQGPPAQNLVSDTESDDDGDEDYLSEISDLEDPEEQVPPPVPPRPVEVPRSPQRPVFPIRVAQPAPRLSHQRIQEVEANARPDENCTICLEQLGADRSNYRALDCGHIFHRACIETWMAVPSHTCPLCRSNSPVSPSHNDVPMPDAPPPSDNDLFDRIIATLTDEQYIGIFGVPRPPSSTNN